MLVIAGSIALSDFRKQKIVAQLAAQLAGCVAIEASFIHFVDLADISNNKHAAANEQALGAADVAVLAQLLDYGYGIGTATTCEASNQITKLTVPRIGTISPWASKATDIIQHCGLKQIDRIERGIHWTIWFDRRLPAEHQSSLNNVLSGIIFDPMIETLLDKHCEAEALFGIAAPAALQIIDILGRGLDALLAAEQQYGFALDAPEQQYLIEQYTALGRNPTDVELMMFAQVNSEHCRHKIFNADWSVDKAPQAQSLFGMIRTTHANNNRGTLVAYKDNAAVLAGAMGYKFQPNIDTGVFEYQQEAIHVTAKVETHNHPTAISPFAGAATGAGGEIRDEAATGRGGKPKAGLVGFAVSHLRLPGLAKPWEMPESKPQRIASPLQIMLQAPLGAAAFNNEFGRPNVSGYFRTFEQASETTKAHRYGYHKPIMLAGGLGNIRPQQVEKQRIPVGAPIVIIGGPGMLIGLGGGAASSVAAGSSRESLDFASVQRGNPEMQRRCQEVIDSCCAMGDNNPIISIHDVGAGGICNALPELLHAAGRGGRFELRHILNHEPGMSPMQIWCNESQERYVIAINPEQFARFERICKRERCLYARVGEATDDNRLILTDQYFAGQQNGHPEPVDLSMHILFGLPPKMQRNAVRVEQQPAELNLGLVDIKDAWRSVLAFPAVADKTFLVTIGDRSVGGMIARDQMVGPWQVPVADVAVSTAGYSGVSGEAMALGERAPLAVIDAPASGRMAVGEALTNLVSANITELGAVRLAANWMLAAGQPGQDAALYATVESVAMELCPALGIAIPVGKDSMSMTTSWKDDNQQTHSVIAPLSLVITAFAPVENVNQTATPELRLDQGDTDLWLVDLGAGKNRLGGSVLAQVNRQVGRQSPDFEAAVLKGFLELIIRLNKQGLLLAYHDRSDGGLAAVLAEMSFTARCGLDLDVSMLGSDAAGILFNEELGAVLQCRRTERALLKTRFADAGLQAMTHVIGKPVVGNTLAVKFNRDWSLSLDRVELHRAWSEMTWKMQSLRDNPDCAQQEYDRLLALDDPGMQAALTFDPTEEIAAPLLNLDARPRIAILREQGVNGQLEMAASFDRAGFQAVDISMSDLANDHNLQNFKGFVACGGFSYGDVLGAGEGWGKSILFNAVLRQCFSDFFNRNDTFALGVCNGCQMLSAIKSLVPGAARWPKFVRNLSEQYEARFVTVKIGASKSIMFDGMAHSSFGIAVAHSEGRVLFQQPTDMQALQQSGQIAMRFVDNHHNVTDRYPLNPNGSPKGVTGFTNADGRFTIMMPHPERVFRTVTHSWHPDTWPEQSPWLRIFQNARRWVEHR